MMFIGAPPAMPMVAQGRLRVLAVTSPKRRANMPDFPTLAESGVSGFDATVEDAIFVPAGTPASTVALLNREISQLMKLPDVRKRWMELGAEPGSASTPEQFKVTLELGAIKWGKVIQEANIKLD
jgi:tripartite-type tricarboxylate transporter receptor subunit TctC